MTKKSKKTSTELVKPFEKERFKKNMNSIYFYEWHPEKIYEKIWEITKIPVEKMSDEDKKYLTTSLGLINNFNSNHVPLAETQQEWSLRTTVIELTNDLIQEYNCNTTLEKSLCEIIANSYWKIMSVSKKLNNQFWAEYLSKDRNEFMKILSLEQDRANRNYLNALNNLLEIKKPQMSINIKTKNAYIGQNQQFNNNINTNEENIKT